MIRPVLVVVEHQRVKAEKLREYCWDLDKTDLILVKSSNDDPVVYPENIFHSRQAHALHKAAEHMGGEPFIWVEPDSIPLKPGWAQVLANEYEKCGNKFLLSGDSQPFDLIGGIGVYCGETSWLVPTDYPKSSWDLWLLEAVPHLIARTPLIQHSYGEYGPDGFVKREHRFPRDNKMLREEAVLFHRDPFQDLITQSA